MNQYIYIYIYIKIHIYTYVLYLLIDFEDVFLVISERNRREGMA